MDLVTIKSFNESTQAHVAKSKLESEGIECWLIDEHMTTVLFAGNAFGGVKLQVHKSQADKAKELLKGFD